jgi:Mce-associated membrane protein
MTVANQSPSTGLELPVPIDSDSVTGGAPTGIEETSAPGDPDADGVERDHASDEAGVVEYPVQPARRFSWTRMLAYVVVPILALVVALGVGYLKWQEGSAQLSEAAAVNSVQAAKESTIAMLSYRPISADKDLTAAADRLTGSFRDDYTKLIREVVIPSAGEKQISAVATIPAAVSVSASQNQAVVLVFIDQTTVMGTDPPVSTTSSARITLDKVGDRWLISQFEPV